LVLNSTAPSTTAKIVDVQKGLPMQRLFALDRNEHTGNWDLRDEKGETLKSFSTKAQAIVSGMLEKTVKPSTVRIFNEDGTHQTITYRCEPLLASSAPPPALTLGGRNPRSQLSD
jgi:hypothetical protein